jgi:hypothetical protein
MKRIFVLSVIAAGITCAADFFPLAAGNEWVYREDRTGDTLTIRVGSEVSMQSGKTYHDLMGFANRKALARIDQSGNLVALDEETGRESLLAGFAELDGSWWPALDRECFLSGQTQGKRIQHEGPGGRWSNVLAIHYQSSACADAGTIEEQFAENIGMVRRVVTTIAGPRTFDLVYARVGTQTIETQPRGRFSVTVHEPAGEQEFQVTLRIDTGLATGLRLRFPSAQEFDVVLRDQDGTVVWRWSEGQFFDQAAKERLISDGWTRTVVVPKRPGDLTGFTFGAWLTTSPGEPSFAAISPLPHPRPMTISDRVASISVSPAIVRGGETVTVTVKLEGVAPIPAVTVFMGSTRPHVAEVPIVYYIPAGQTSGQFRVTTSPGWPSQEVRLSASSGGRTATATLRVN